jgi:hypothetical protein
MIPGPEVTMRARPAHLFRIAFRIAALLPVFGCTGAIGSSGPGAGTGMGAAGAGTQGTAGATGAAGTTTGGGGATGTAGGAATGTAGGAATGAGGGGTIAADPNAAGLLPLRRLTGREYRNTVRDLLGDTTSLAADDVPQDPDDLTNNAFPFRQPTLIGTADANTFQSAAELLVKNLGSRLSTLLPCAPANAAAEAGCATQFINTFGLKAYRRPLTSAETANLMGAYQAGRTTLALDFNGAIGLVVETILQAPAFLYHWEMDSGPAVREGNVVRLGDYQMASRLSYYLWGSMPDPMLFAAAADGQLATADGVRTQAERMLRDPKAQDMVADFVSDWLDVNTIAIRPKDPAYYPTWNAELVSAIETEFRSFSTSIVFGTGLLRDLFTSRSTSVNQALAAVYGVSGVSGSAPRPVTLNANERAGILTTAGFLAVHGVANGSSPVMRGHAVWSRLLCGTIPDPPNVVPPAKPPTPGLTTRQRFEEHDMNPCTGACHAIMDPIGFGFEHFDGIGRFRTTDQNLPVDSSGSIIIDGQTKTFADAVGLANILAASPQVAACLTRQLVRYALNRWDTAADLHSIQSAEAAFRNGGLDIRTLVSSVATTRTFRYRAPAAGEVLP